MGGVGVQCAESQSKLSPEGVLVERTLEKDDSTSHCHPLCSHCMFYKRGEPKKPLYIQVKITCRDFIVTLTSLPFSHSFYFSCLDLLEKSI